MSQQQFENFTASSLYCEKCKTAMPVRDRRSANVKSLLAIN